MIISVCKVNTAFVIRFYSETIDKYMPIFYAMNN